MDHFNHSVNILPDCKHVQPNSIEIICRTPAVSMVKSCRRTKRTTIRNLTKLGKSEIVVVRNVLTRKHAVQPLSIARKVYSIVWRRLFFLVQANLTGPQLQATSIGRNAFLHDVLSVPSGARAIPRLHVYIAFIYGIALCRSSNVGARSDTERLFQREKVVIDQIMPASTGIMTMSKDTCGSWQENTRTAVLASGTQADDKRFAVSCKIEECSGARVCPRGIECVRGRSAFWHNWL